MIFSTVEYAKMINFCKSRIESHTALTVEDAMTLKVPYDSLLSLHNQLLLRTADDSFHHLRKYEQDAIIQRFLTRFNTRKESLLEIASEYRIGTYKLAKIYLERTLGPQVKLSTFIAQPDIILDRSIRNDLLQMISQDQNSSVESDLLKETTGRDYELLLINLLQSRHACFETEEESRAQGKPKTPDILFLIPMATTTKPYDHIIVQEEHIVINWIDSKAMFADMKTFSEHLTQLESYRNRYGRGMVIYWQGVVEDVFSCLVDDMIVIRDTFPDYWIFPTGEEALEDVVPAFDTIDLSY